VDLFAERWARDEKKSAILGVIFLVIVGVLVIGAVLWLKGMF
jgi:hypothetical protein